MKPVRPLLLLCLVCAPAFAQDDPTKNPPPAPTAPKADPPAEAKKERKVDPAAMKALDRHVAQLHLPSAAGVKELSGKGEVEQNGQTIGMSPKWNVEKGFDLDVTLPDQIKQMAEAQGVSAEDAAVRIKNQLGMMVGLNSAFEAPGRNWSHFDVAFKQEGDDQVVDLTPFDKEADADSRQYVFGKDGLLKSTSMTPKSTGDDSQMPPGLTFDASWKFEKKGEKSLLSSRTLSIMGTEITTTFTYFDGPNGSFLPKDATITTMQGDEVIKFHDYTVDGKLVESTKAPEAAKPAEKPKDEKPAAEPPAPAPKEEKKDEK